MIEKLNTDQEGLINIVRDRWIEYGLSYQVFNRAEFEKGITSIYSWIGLPKPIIIEVDSPMSAQYAAHFLKNSNIDSDQVRDQVWDQVRDQVWAQVMNQVWDQVGDQVRDQVMNQVWAQVMNQVWDQVRDQVGDQVRDQVWAQVMNQVWDQVMNQVRDQVRDQVGDQKIQFENFASYGNISDFGWVSFYDYFQEVNVKLGDKENDFNTFKNFLKTGFYDCIQLKRCVIVCKRPISIKKNSISLHSIDGPAIKWEDGYELYFVNGRSISKDNFQKISDKKYTIVDFAKETNEEVKSACIALMQEKFGDTYLLDFFNEFLKEIDTFVNKKDEKFLEGTTGGMNIGVYTLFTGNINETKVSYVRCYCPSTDRMFYLGVDNGHMTAKDAIASLYRVPNKLEKHIKSIRRQGERFSTCFTDEGKKILSLLSKEEVSNVVSITGDKYFELMEYEY
jgi:hypothetical protein